MKKNLSARFFNLGLFVEGLKRLRVIGVATAIISLSFSALIPCVSWMQETGSQLWEINANVVCAPMYFTVIIAPFFVLSMFSYLHKRKESDFFHAIPYTRTCVYVSFAASALAMIFAIQLASAAVGGILWGMHPTAVYDLGAYISMVLTGMLSAAMLAGFMAVAVTLTGTKLTTVLVFGIFCLFTRIVAAYMSGVISDNIDVLDLVPMYYLRFDWFLPFAYFASGLGIYSSSGGINHFYRVFNPLLDPACIIYSVVITLLAFTLGWLFYVKRKSETAGHTTSNRVTQHVFRCLFTMPLALVIPFLLLCDSKTDVSTLFVLLIVTLVTYYLYELITTKRLKNLVSATPWLLVLLGGILLFTGAYYTVEGVVLNTPIRAEDVSYVSLEAEFPSYDNYQKHLLYKSGTADEDIIEQICNAYAITQKCDKADDYSDHFNSDQYGYGQSNWIVRETVIFKMKNGQSITRTVCFAKKETESLYKAYYQSVDIDDTLWDIPKKINGLSRITGTYGTFSPGKKYERQITLPAFTRKAVYEIICEEYMALPIEEKQQIRAEYSSLKKIINSDVAERACVEIVFRSGDSNYSISIYIDERMPKSLAALQKYAEGSRVEVETY